MNHYDYDDDVLMCGTGAGFMAVECMTGIYKAFEEYGVIPGKAMCSSGSTLFASLYYSVESTKWFEAFMATTTPNDFINFNLSATIKTAIAGGTFIFDNDAVYDLLKKYMTGNASKRVTTSVTRNSDWSTHMKKVTPGWATAATSIPFIFKPVKIGNEYWSDGGVINNLPVPSIEESKRYKRIFVFVPPPNVYSDGTFLITQLLNLLNAALEGELSQLKELGFFDLPNVTLIQPKETLGGSLLGWSPDYQLRESTYQLTKEILKDVQLDEK